MSELKCRHTLLQLFSCCYGWSCLDQMPTTNLTVAEARSSPLKKEKRCRRSNHDQLFQEEAAGGGSMNVPIIIIRVGWWIKGCSRAERPHIFLHSATLYANDFIKTACDFINWMKEGLVHILQWKCRSRIESVLIHSKRRTIQSRFSQDRMPQNSEQLIAS